MTIPCRHRSKHHPSGNSGAAPARSRERAGWKVGEQATCPLRVQGSVLHMLIRSHGSVRAVHGPPFLLQYGIEILVLPLALQPHALTKMPFAAQTEALK